ncbi:MAG: hypothetical protein R2704_10545 [Microthrixaceae bacterium]
MNKPMKLILAVVGVAVLLVAGGVAFWALNDSAEDEFELSSTETTEGSGEETDTAEAPRRRRHLDGRRGQRGRLSNR